MASLPKRLIPYAFGALTLTAGTFSAVALVPQTAIYAQALPPAAAHGFFGADFAVQDNALVLRRVMPDGPAAKAGLQAGDRITSLNGQTVTTPQQAHDIIEALAPNAAVSVAYVRNGASATATVTMGERPARPEGQRPNPPAALKGFLDIPADQRFDHLREGQFSYTTADNKQVTIQTIPGTVSGANASSSSITIAKNSGGSATYTVNSSTTYEHAGSLSDIANGDKVVIMVVADQPTVAVQVSKGGDGGPLGMPFGGPKGDHGPRGQGGQGSRIGAGGSITGAVPGNNSFAPRQNGAPRVNGA